MEAKSTQMKVSFHTAGRASSFTLEELITTGAFSLREWDVAVLARELTQDSIAFCEDHWELRNQNVFTISINESYIIAHLTTSLVVLLERLIQEHEDCEGLFTLLNQVKTSKFMTGVMIFYKGLVTSYGQY